MRISTAIPTATVVKLGLTLGLALGLAHGLAPNAAMAQQGTDDAAASTGSVGAPASEETGLNAVYSTKSVMGISTGTDSATDADAAGDEDRTAAQSDDAESDAETN